MTLGQSKANKFYTDEKNKELGEMTSFLQPVWLGRPYQEYKTPARITIWVNEAHNPPTTKMWQQNVLYMHVHVITITCIMDNIYIVLLSHTHVGTWIENECFNTLEIASHKI